MRVYLIKRKGATIAQNLVYSHKVYVEDEFIGHVGLWFFRKKEAKRYLSSFEHPELFEVVGATVDKVEQDNRKTK